MKRIFLIIIMIFSLKSYSQQAGWTVVPLEDMLDWGAERNVYFKDMYHSLDKFVGTWEYQQGSEYFKITLYKRVAMEHGNPPIQKEDNLYGRYEYRQNGNIIFDTYSVQGIKIASYRLENSNVARFSYGEPSLTHCRKNRRAEVTVGYSVDSIGLPVLTWSRVDDRANPHQKPCPDSTTLDLSDFLTPPNMVLTKQ